MEILLSLFALLCGAGIVVLSIPSIVKVAQAKKLFDTFDFRKVHTGNVPPLGGVAIFFGFVLTTIVLTDNSGTHHLKYLWSAVTIMFFIGLKDDLLNISARNKFIVQGFATFLLVTLGDVRINNFHGLLGLYEVHYIPAVFVSAFLILAIINAFNLIDGVDGLSSGLGITTSIILGIWFLNAGFSDLAILAFALVGCLSGFFVFNVFGNTNKLFMGDTGSLVVGLVISVLVIHFTELNALPAATYKVKSAPSVSFALIGIPMCDMLRVMIIRMLNGKSPFSADKNHIHHRLLSIFNVHLKVTLIVLLLQLTLVFVGVFLSQTNINVGIQLLIVLSSGLFISYLPSMVVGFKYISRDRRFKALPN